MGVCTGGVADACLSRLRVYICHVPQVWESTPGFGDKPFLDTLWTSIDEVGLCLKEGGLKEGGHLGLSLLTTHRL